MAAWVGATISAESGEFAEQVQSVSVRDIKATALGLQYGRGNLRYRGARRKNAPRAWDEWTDLLIRRKGGNTSIYIFGLCVFSYSCARRALRMLDGFRFRNTDCASSPAAVRTCSASTSGVLATTFWRNGLSCYRSGV
jgi:hypothetical protein